MNLFQAAYAHSLNQNNISDIQAAIVAADSGNPLLLAPLMESMPTLVRNLYSETVFKHTLNSMCWLNDYLSFKELAYWAITECTQSSAQLLMAINLIENNGELLLGDLKNLFNDALNNSKAPLYLLQNITKELCVVSQELDLYGKMITTVGNDIVFHSNYSALVDCIFGDNYPSLLENIFTDFETPFELAYESMNDFAVEMNLETLKYYSNEDVSFDCDHSFVLDENEIEASLLRLLPVDSPTLKNRVQTLIDIGLKKGVNFSSMLESHIEAEDILVNGSLFTIQSENRRSLVEIVLTILTDNLGFGLEELFMNANKEANEWGASNDMAQALEAYRPLGLQYLPDREQFIITIEKNILFDCIMKCDYMSEVFYDCSGCDDLHYLVKNEVLDPIGKIQDFLEPNNGFCGFLEQAFDDYVFEFINSDIRFLFDD